jgi:uncharacterized membrane protein YeiH
MSLNFDTIYTEVVQYFQNNIYITIALAGTLLLLLFKKTKLFFIILLILCINIALFYVISQISTVGTDQGEKLVGKSAGQISNQ